MILIHRVKNKIGNLPYWIGNVLSKIPYRFRPGIGNVYEKRKKELSADIAFGNALKKGFAFDRMKEIVEYSYRSVPFYKKFYDENNFNPSHLQEFSDLKKIPIINKKILQSVSLEERSSSVKNKYLVNTGGSSGNPLSFYIEPDSIGHEWAHMHHVWASVGFNYKDLKLTFNGINRSEELVSYDAARHQYNFNVYLNLSDEDFKREVLNLFGTRRVKYLHGYPSAIFEFTVRCQKCLDDKEQKLLNRNLKGVLFGSEFPQKSNRAFIESYFKVSSVSWYGHTERAVLAYEKEDKETYFPFLTYGYAEVENIGEQNHLVGTSYYNYASPLIRYDTEDSIYPVIKDGLLTSFRIEGGRSGEFILDKNGQRIPLTALIFGRHHDLFNVCGSIQVSQKKAGEATIHYTLNPGVTIDNPRLLFDSEGVEIVFHFSEESEPQKSISGKVNLLVR